jgi:hypothetical protein
MLRQLLGDHGRLALLLIGEGTHSPREVSRAVGVPVTATLPHDPRAAAVLSDGAGSRRGLQARPLIRAAGPAVRALRDAAGAQAARHPQWPGSAREASASR